MNNHGYLHHPTLQGDTLVFVCDDDLWQVSTTGGAARRLTAGLSEPSMPCLSPDGQWIAFTGRDEQQPEIYLMAAGGGPARRLTWLGPDTIVRGWTREGHILFVSTYGQPFFRNYRAFTLAPAGGAPQMLPLDRPYHVLEALLKTGWVRDAGATYVLLRRNGQPEASAPSARRHIRFDQAVAFRRQANATVGNLDTDRTIG